MTKFGYDSPLYYGRKMKRHFGYLDKLLVKLEKKLETAEAPFDDQILDQILRISARAQGINYGVVVTNEKLDMPRQLEQATMFMQEIPREELEKAMRIHQEKKKYV